MNKLFQRIVVYLFPFYPIVAWLFQVGTHKPLSNFITFFWAAIACYQIVSKSNKVPSYLLFLILFTLYHIGSIYFLELLPYDQGWLDFLRSEKFINACLVLFVIENLNYDDAFFNRLNKNIFIVICISLLVSLVQTTDPTFFFNMDVDQEMEYIGDMRIFSIYSWTNLNSLGITFPILIGLLLSSFERNKLYMPVSVVAGIIVSFLTKARYVMISTIIVISQLFFKASISLKQKISFVIIIIIGIVALFLSASYFGYSIQDTVQDRILEKSNDKEMGSAMARVTSYYVFLAKFPEHPWLGVGPKTRDDVVQLLGGEAPLIHVGYLSYLYFYGIAGFSLLAMSLYFMLRRAWIIGKSEKFWGIFYGLVTFCFANITMVYFNFSEPGIIIAIIYSKYFIEKLKSEADEENKEYELPVS